MCVVVGMCLWARGGMRGTVGEVREVGNLGRQMVASHSTLK